MGVHGSRLVLYLVFRGLPLADFGNPDLDFDPLLATVPALARRALVNLILPVEKDFAGSYLASLFKNAGKCRILVDDVRAVPSSEPSTPILDGQEELFRDG